VVAGPTAVSCDRRRRRAYYAEHREELYAKREAVREAARQAHLKALVPEHRKRVAAAKKEAEAGARRQREFLASIGVEDLSPEEVTRRARRGVQGRATTPRSTGG
jgi:hypothetical protein